MVFPHQKISKGILVIICIVLAIVFTSVVFPSFERVHWHKQVILTIKAPPQKFVTMTSNFVKDVWHHYIAITEAAKENDRLEIQVAELNKRLFEMEGVRKENEELYKTLQIAGAVKLEGVGARVIASDPTAEFKTIALDKGFNEGIRKNMVVIGPGGLVGRIGQVSSSESRVLLISDPNSAIDVIVQRSGVRALLVGTSLGNELRPFFSLSRLEHLKRASDIKQEDVVVTSGFDRLCPAGIPVGTVHNVEEAASGIFKGAEVVPFVDMSQTRSVMVIK